VNKAKVLAVFLASGALAATAYFAKPHEGYVPHVYLDPVGIPTSCFGHVGPENTPGRTFTGAQCDKLLEADLHVASDAVRRCIRVPLTPGQQVALTSFAFNAGGPNLCKSTLARLANAGEPAIKWCFELNRWVYAKGKKLPGLVRRRREEAALCVAT
jgi:lysozyme